jgi:hypothetical protein
VHVGCACAGLASASAGVDAVAAAATAASAVPARAFYGAPLVACGKAWWGGDRQSDRSKAGGGSSSAGGLCVCSSGRCNRSAVYVKGAPEVVASMCTAFVGPDGQQCDFSASARTEVTRVYAPYSVLHYTVPCFTPPCLAPRCVWCVARPVLNALP